MTGRWTAISPSQFPWEQDALDHVQRAFPNREPFRVYSNFEFIADDGSINEVDLLIISRYIIFLVEVKSRPGEGIWKDNRPIRRNRAPLSLNSNALTETIAMDGGRLPLNFTGRALRVFFFQEISTA